MDFADLPLEIIPFISQHLLRPQHLAQACLINKNFYFYTVPFLYERIAIFAWHRNGKKKATRLFWTLANCPQLSRYVLRLELRDFPKAISRESALELTKTCVRAIDNCVNLQSCTWTREGSLKDDILEALARCPNLEVLEINGRHTHNYDPALLSEFSRLRKIAFIMPSGEVMQQLPSCVQHNHATLQALTIICKFTSVVTDASLRAMAPALSSLEHIHIAGCPKVTHQGIIDILSASTSGVKDLALEGVSPSFDMNELSSYSFRASTFTHLHSLALTFPVSSLMPAWLANVETMLWDAPIQKFHLYASGGQRAGPTSLDSSFLRRFIGRHAGHLTRLAVLRLSVSLQSLDFIVRNGVRLEQLYVSIWRHDLNKLGPIIGQSRSLRALHVTYAYNDQADSVTADTDEIDEDSLFNETAPEDVESEDHATTSIFDVSRPLPSIEELEAVASHFGKTVVQFGVQTRVWQVERVAVRKPDGELAMRVRLGPYENPDVPGVFLVVQT